jgi:large subunit ribosomal protein L17
MAMLRNLASSLFLTERDADPDIDQNVPKVKGRVITTMQKAKEVRPLVEKCITLACRALRHERAAEEHASDADPGSEKWRQWRTSPQWQQWNQAMAPAVAARRRVLQLIGDKQAVRVLFGSIAPRFEDRPGGYTRILRLPKPRLGDAGERAVLELVGVHDRVRAVSERPSFAGADEPAPGAAEPSTNAAADDAS